MPDSFSDQPVRGIVQSCPAKTPKKETYWIEIELIDQDDRPIPFEEYLVELPDGTRAPGFLDDQGFARFSGIPTSGTCKINFSKLDSDACEFVSTQPAKAGNE